MSHEEPQSDPPTPSFQVPASLLQASKARQAKLTAKKEEAATKKEVSAPSRIRKKWQATEPKHVKPPTNTLMEIQKIQKAREERRQYAEWIKDQREGKLPETLAIEEYVAKITEFKEKWKTWWNQLCEPPPLFQSSDMSIQVCVRKRPVQPKELAQNGFDVVTTMTSRFPNAHVFVHEPKLSLDQTRTITTHPYQFDQVFDESAINIEVYEQTLKPLLPQLFQGKHVSLFCYGQTSSGKTHTLFGPEGGKGKNLNDKELGLYNYACTEIFKLANESHFPFHISFLELYSGRVYDLLNSRKHVKLLEKDGNFQFLGLKEYPAYTLETCLEWMQKGLETRTTASTELNSTSSRSHAIFRLENRNTGSLLTLIDLAGSERGVDNPMSSKDTRRESASINQSLLALKECIRALHLSETYIPYRSNKLTCVLRECFKESICVMMLNVAPTHLSIEQTLSCLHYAHRVKEYMKNNDVTQIKGTSLSRREKKKWRNQLARSSSTSLNMVSGFPVGKGSKKKDRGKPSHSSKDDEGEEEEEKYDSNDEEEKMAADDVHGDSEREEEKEKGYGNEDSENEEEEEEEKEEEEDSMEYLLSDSEDEWTPSASKMSLYGSQDSFASNGTETPDGTRTPQHLGLSNASTNLGNGKKVNQALLEYHAQVISVGNSFINEEEALLRYCSDHGLDLEEYKKALDTLLDNHLKSLFRLKAILIDK